MGFLATNTAVTLLSERLGELEATVRTLKSANKHLELEWEELYDKVRHQMARMSKRVKVDAPEFTPPSEPELTDGGGNRVDPVSAKILARRAGNGVKQ